MGRILFIDARGAQPGSHPFQRGRVRPFAQELRYRLVQKPLGIVLRDAGRGRDRQRKGGRIDRQPVIARARIDGLAGQHQLAPQDRGLGRSAQQLGQHRQRRRRLLVARVPFRRHDAAGQHRLRHAGVGHIDPAVGALRGLLRARRALGRGFGRDRAIVFLRQRLDLIQRHVARHDQHRRVRRIVAVVPVQRVCAGQPFHLGPPADHGAAIGVVVVLDRRNLFAKERRGVAVGALRAFLQHDLPLGLPVILADAKIGHPVRLHPHDQRQAVGGDTLEVGGEVVAGKGVVGPAIRGHGLGQFARRQRVGALEHQVFQIVGKAGLARHLVGGSDPVPDHLHDDRGAVILDHHRLQAVVQREAADAGRHLGQCRQRRGQQTKRGRGGRGMKLSGAAPRAGWTDAGHRRLLGGWMWAQGGRARPAPQATDA